MHNLIIIRIILVSVLLAAVSGCATQPGKSSPNSALYCSMAGAAAGGGAGAAITLAAAPIGVFIGAVAGYLACDTDEPVAQQVAAAPAPEPTPAPVRERDSDGDGVVDRLDRCPDTPAGEKVDAYGCPKILMTLTGILFKFDSSEIEPNSAQTLDEAVTALRKSSASEVRLVGHTDSTGSDAYNLKLSDRRAAAVRDYLVNHGIDASRLSTEGQGESQPVASNDTDDGRHQNRRVELHVVNR